MKLEKIYWRDINGLSDHWMTKDELVKEALKSFLVNCVSVGDVVYENDDFVIISSTFDGDDKYHDASMIMKSVIVKRETM
jgi:hypothetical protein